MTYCKGKVKNNEDVQQSDTIEESEFKDKKSFTVNAVYNDQAMPITVYYSDYDENGGISLDFFVFDYDDKKQVVNTSVGIDQLLFWSVDYDNFTAITLADYNFDNYMDFSVYSIRSGTSNLREEFFIYNPKSKSYKHNYELSDMEDVWIDPDKKTIKTYGRGGHAGLIFTFREFRWENDNLIMIDFADQDYDSELGVYVLINRTLQNNGTWLEKTETFIEADFVEYQIGEYCPAGGIIFFDRREGQAGISFEQWEHLSSSPKKRWRYLSAAPAHSEIQGNLGEALIKCLGLNIDYYDDWYLPSKNELELIYKNLKAKNLGDFKSDWYWSSTENDDQNVYGIFFKDGSGNFDSPDKQGFARAIRSY